MGNPPFAVASLEALFNSRHELVAVVSNPPRPMGRGRIPQETPVGRSARQRGLLLLQPESLLESGFQDSLRELNPDLFVVVAFKILPEGLLQIPPKGSINLHASLLPAYRGAAPIQWALINGDEETGLTTFLIAPQVDTGAILLQTKLSIDPADNRGTLEARMSIQGAELLLKTVDRWDEGQITPTPQDERLVTKAPKIKKALLQVDWTLPAEALYNRVRAAAPRPGLWTRWGKKRVKIFATRPAPGGARLPSGVVAVEGQRLLVGTGTGKLELLELQPEGKERLAASAFLRGYSLRTGDRLGP